MRQVTPGKGSESWPQTEEAGGQFLSANAPEGVKGNKQLSIHRKVL